MFTNLFQAVINGLIWLWGRIDKTFRALARHALLWVTAIWAAIFGLASAAFAAVWALLGTLLVAAVPLPREVNPWAAWLLYIGNLSQGLTAARACLAIVAAYVAAQVALLGVRLVLRIWRG